MCPEDVETRTFRGRVKSFDPTKGYGFISSEEAFSLYERDVFLHYKEAKHLDPAMDSFLGAEVTFTVHLQECHKPQARHVSFFHASSQIESTCSNLGLGAQDCGEKSYVGHVKSYNEERFYGFISCEEVFKLYHRDVFLSFYHAEELRNAGGLFKGAEVIFTIALGPRLQPKASNVLWKYKPSDDNALLPWESAGPMIHEMPVTRLAPGVPDDWYNHQRRCEFDLNIYAHALKHLNSLMSAGSSDKSGAHLRNILKQAKGSIRCGKCRQDACLGVLSLLEESDARWDEPAHPSHRNLKCALDARLAPPSKQPQEVPIARIRFTHQMHSNRFRHGEHAGQDIDWLVQQLSSGCISPKDHSMTLNVVLFHGEYRSLNNRHAVALVRYAEVLERRGITHSTCFVRVWPLVRGLHLDDGSQQEVAGKFLSANSSTTDGKAIIGHSSRSEQMTEVRLKTDVHISNIDFTVSEDDLDTHLNRAGFEPVLVSIARRKNGKSNGHGWATFTCMKHAENMVSSGLPALKGRELCLRLDVGSAIDISAEPSGGWVRCKQCQARCASLIDTLLVEDVRLARDGTPAEVFDKKLGYFLIAGEHALVNCDEFPHPDIAIMSFKLKKVQCRECCSEIGNIQDANAMEGLWSEAVGAHAVHFKCEQVLLELTDCRTTLLESKKWTILAKALGCHAMSRMSQVRMRQIIQLPERSSGKELRLVSLQTSQELSGIS